MTPEDLIDDREMLQSILDSIPIMICVYSPSGEVSLVNRELTRLMGWTLEDFQRNDVMELCYPDPKYRREVWEYMMEPGPKWKDLRVTTRQGDQLDSSWTNVALPDGTSIGMGIDATEQKRLQARLRRVEKIEALATLAGGIAHDLNNILSPILLSAENLLLEMDGKLPSSESLTQALESIRFAANRGKELVTHITSSSRPTEKIRKPEDIAEIVREAFDLLRASVPPRIEMKLHLETKKTVCSMDRAEIHRVIMNLCSNAIQAIEGTGRLDIVVEESPVEPQTETSFVRVSVHDTGKGIPQETIESIFDPYFTTKPSGTGMGLALVKRVVEEHGGAVTVKSDMGEGTEFSVDFPCSKEQPVVRRTGPVPVPLGSGKRVLLVDDEAAIVESLIVAMKRFDYEVTGTTSSRKALELLTSTENGFDVVLADQTMPEMTGLELAKAIREKRADLPIILCSGQPDDIRMEVAEELGIRHFLSKPFSLREVAEMMRRALG
jgi:PAS domain S-box-containing protein